MTKTYKRHKKKKKSMRYPLEWVPELIELALYVLFYIPRALARMVKDIF